MRTREIVLKKREGVFITTNIKLGTSNYYYNLRRFELSIFFTYLLAFGIQLI